MAKYKRRISHNRAQVYHALAALNRDIEKVLCDLDRIEELRLFRHRWQREFLNVWRATVEETRAWASFEVVETLHQREEREWTSFGRARERFEQPSAAPSDALIPTKSRQSTAKSR